MTVSVGIEARVQERIACPDPRADQGRTHIPRRASQLLHSQSQPMCGLAGHALEFTETAFLGEGLFGFETGGIEATLQAFFRDAGTVNGYGTQRDDCLECRSVQGRANTLLTVQVNNAQSRDRVEPGKEKGSPG